MIRKGTAICLWLFTVWLGYYSREDYFSVLIEISKDVAQWSGLIPALHWIEHVLGFRVFSLLSLSFKLYFFLPAVLNIGVVALWFGNKKLGRMLTFGLVGLLLTGFFISIIGKLFALPYLHKMAYSYLISLVKNPLLPLLVLPVLHYLSYLQLNYENAKA